MNSPISTTITPSSARRLMRSQRIRPPLIARGFVRARGAGLRAWLWRARAAAIGPAFAPARRFPAGRGERLRSQGPLSFVSARPGPARAADPRSPRRGERNSRVAEHAAPRERGVGAQGLLD